MSYKYINKLIITNIDKSVDELFPKLIIDDKFILKKYTKLTIDKICIKFGFKREPDYYNQWLQNNNQDIKAVILLHLPFLDSVKDDGKVLSNLTNFSNIIVNNSSYKLNKNILKTPRHELINKELYYSNIAIDYISYDQDILLNGYSEKRNMINNKFYLIDKTLDIIANKLYINWVNIQPLNLNNYKESQIYIDTINNINLLQNTGKIDINNASIDISNYYNVFRNFIYEDLKNIKWTIYNRNISIDKGYYYIQIIDKIFNINQILEYERFDLLNKEKKMKFTNLYKSVINKLYNNNNILKNINFEYDVLESLMKFMVSNDKDNNFNDLVFEKFKAKQKYDEINDTKEDPNDNNNNDDNEIENEEINHRFI